MVITENKDDIAIKERKQLLNFRQENAGSVGVLDIEGEMTVGNVAELKAMLMQSLTSVDHLVLNLEKVTIVDISLFQVLCSAHRTSAGLKKNLTIVGELPEPLKQLVEIAGFEHNSGCASSACDTCLWTDRVI